MRKYDEKFLRSLEHDFKLQILNFFEILKSQKISEKGILIPLNKQSKKIKLKVIELNFGDFI